MTTHEAITNRINSLCTEKGITINHLSTISGIPRSTVKNILYGKSHNTGIITLKKICDGLEICLADFFNTPELRNLDQEIE